MASLPRPLILASSSLLALGMLLAACSSDGTEASSTPTEPDPCARLATCCDALPSPFAESCRSTLDTHGGRREAPDACRSALTSFEEAGACAVGGQADAGTSSDASGSARAICEAFIACIGGTTPEGLGAIVSAYGPNGSCWTAGNEELCLRACRTGLRNARKGFPDERACPECLAASDCVGARGGSACDAKSGRCVQCTSDASCSGATPACHPTKNTCVGCTTAAHCVKGGACDAVTNECASCKSNAECIAPTPFCKKGQGQKPACVACLEGADCSTGACNDNKCCQPETCGELKWSAGINPSTWICGAAQSAKCGGATIQCGACPKGVCTPSGLFSRCSLEDTPCTPGVSGTCQADEVCTYVPNKSGYVCSYDLRNTTCVYGGESYKCGNYHFSCTGANLVTNGKCKAYCKTTADCPGSTCDYYPDLGYGVCK